MAGTGWSASEGLISRADAKAKIVELAKEEGITGSFKVYYNDQLIANPDDLPEQVAMNLVRVSAVLDNA
jgi:hypothetical protein